MKEKIVIVVKGGTPEVYSTLENTLVDFKLYDIDKYNYHLGEVAAKNYRSSFYKEVENKNLNCLHQFEDLENMIKLIDQEGGLAYV
jgi:hypothetical protein